MENRFTTPRLAFLAVVMALIFVSLIECSSICRELKISDSLRYTSIGLLTIAYAALLIIRLTMAKRKYADKHLLTIRIIIIVISVLPHLLCMILAKPHQISIAAIIDPDTLLPLSYFLSIEALIDIYLWLTDKRPPTRRK